MVSLEKFRNHFKGFEDYYVIIGGTACTVLFENYGEHFRVTKDIDMVVIMENIDIDFTRCFWNFIREAQYKSIYECKQDKKLYRFTNPKSELYPKMIELFSRRQIEFPIDNNSHLTPIHIDDDISSLSAILLNEDYYLFLKKGIKIIDGLSILDEAHLIPFKIKACLEIKERVEKGERGQSRHIRKHRNDVLKLITLLYENQKVELNSTLSKDMEQFIEYLKNEEISKDLIDKDTAIEMLESIYLDKVNV